VKLGVSWARVRRSERVDARGARITRLALALCLAGLLATASAAAGSNDVPRPPGAVDGRGWELVSQADKNSYQVAQALPISSDGTRVLYRLFAGGAAGSTSGQGVFVATRTPTGWRSHNALPPRATLPASTVSIGAATPDLTSWIASAFEGVGVIQQAPDVSVMRLDDTGDQELLHTFPVFIGLAGVPVVTSGDLRHVLAAIPRGADPSLPGYVAGAIGADNTNVFDLGTSPPTLVSAMGPTGLPPVCGLNGRGGTMDFPGGAVNATSEHWISDDGARAFFSTKGDACSNPRQLYVRDLAAATTRLVSGPPLAGDPDNGIDRFLQATPDGSLAFFRSSTSYDPSDDADGSSSDRDVYRWTAATGALTCVTCVVPGANVPGAAVNQLSSAVVAADGSRVYFPSPAQAAGAPAAGTATVQNLYVWRAGDGSVHYVGPITVLDPGGDPDGLANVPYVGGQTTPDGTVLIFRSNTPGLDALSGSHNGGLYQYYRYDDRDQDLSCLSCPHGASATANVPVDLTGGFPHLAVAPDVRSLTDDGSMVFFATRDTLSVDDVNRTWDIYEWHDGVEQLITNGVTRYPGTLRPYPTGVSADGQDFLFQDPAQLTWEAQDSSYQLYDARIGGGFAQPTPQPGCDGDQCQGPASSPALSDPGSASLRGAHDLAPPARFSVGRPTAAQRARLARTGRLRLSLRVSRPGRISAFAQTLLGGRIRSVGHASVVMRAAGRTTLTLRLTHAARARLAASGRLRLVVAIRFSRAPTSRRLVLVLRTGSHAHGR